MFDLTTRQLKEGFLQPFIAPFTYLTPNQITIVSGIFGVFSCITVLLDNYSVATLFWFINRILDGLDGTVARSTGQQSLYGGYLDIIVDFTIYSAITISITYNESYNTGIYITTDSIIQLWCITAILNGIYFVNAASLFMFSAMHTQLSNELNHELTTVSMSPSTALVEGTETVLVYTAFLLAPQYILYMYVIFGIGVTVTILQRLYDAYYIFDIDSNKQPNRITTVRNTASTSPAKRRSNRKSSNSASPRSRSMSRSR